METEKLGANSTDEGAAEASPAVETSSDGLVSTVDIPDQSEPQQPKGESEGGENERFDKHPRFQEIITERDTARNESSELKQRLSNLEGQISGMKTAAPAKEPQSPVLPFKNIADMDEDELREFQADDPKGYAANLLQQAKYELSQDFENTLSAKDRETAIDSTFQTYGDKNPDFWDKWNSGELKKFMDTNPGHNAISAHLILTSENRETTIRSEERKKLQDEYKLKGNINSLGPSGTFTPEMTGGSDALKNPEKHGGVTNVLLQRHNARAGT